MHLFTFAILVIAQLWSGTLLGAQVVVVASDVAELKTGVMLDTTQSITVPAGKSITMIGQDGATHTIKGTFSGTIASTGEAGGDTEDATMLVALSMLVGGSGNSDSALGTLRGDASSEQPSNPLLVNLTRAGTQCVPTADARMWMKPSTRNRRIKLKELTNGMQVKLDWPAMASEQAWPAEASLYDGAEYLVRTEDQQTPRKITLRVIDGTAGLAPGYLAHLLNQSGCLHQAHAALKSNVD